MVGGVFHRSAGSITTLFMVWCLFPGVHMRAWVGTSGYSYKEWKGHFYPEKIKPAEMLAFYSRKLETVEINNTFYRMPRKEMLKSWAGQVPENFSFVLKASRRITHQQRLKDSRESLSYLLDAASVLEPRRWTG